MRITVKSISYFICFVILLVMPVLFVKAEEATNKIPESPIEISDFKVNKKSFKTGDNVKYSLTIKDIGINDYIAEKGRKYHWDIIPYAYGEPPYYYGSDTVYLYWQSSQKQYIVQAYEWKKADKEKGELTISGKIPVKKGMKTGTWHLAIIYFEYDGESFFVKDSREKIDNDLLMPMTDFSGMDFEVSGTGKPDNKAPSLDLKSMKISKAYVSKNQESVFSIKVNDSSKIEEVVCLWEIYDKTNTSKIGDYSAIYRMKYNKKAKGYQCFVKLDTKYERKAQLVGIEVRDIYGNSKNYYAHRFADHTHKVNKYYNAYRRITVRTK